MSLATGLRIGQAHRQREETLALQDDALAPLRKELALVQGDALYQQAYSVAAGEVHEAILEEIRLSGAGQLSGAVLSQPTARAARNEEFVRLAAEALVRLSNGQLAMSSERRIRILQDQPLA